MVLMTGTGNSNVSVVCIKVKCQHLIQMTGPSHLSFMFLTFLITRTLDKRKLVNLTKLYGDLNLVCTTWLLGITETKYCLCLETWSHHSSRFLYSRKWMMPKSVSTVKERKKFRMSDTHFSGFKCVRQMWFLRIYKRKKIQIN